MARFSDKVGFALPGALVDDVFVANVVERAYKGEILEATASVEDGEKVNPDIRLQHRISIVADAFALENYPYIKYATVAGLLWTVNSTKLQRPRLILSLGGIYNGEKPTP